MFCIGNSSTKGYEYSYYMEKKRRLQIEDNKTDLKYKAGLLKESLEEVTNEKNKINNEYSKDHSTEQRVRWMAALK